MYEKTKNHRYLNTVGKLLEMAKSNGTIIHTIATNGVWFCCLQFTKLLLLNMFLLQIVEFEMLLCIFKAIIFSDCKILLDEHLCMVFVSIVILLLKILLVLILPDKFLKILLFYGNYFIQTCYFIKIIL